LIVDRLIEISQIILTLRDQVALFYLGFDFMSYNNITFISYLDPVHYCVYYLLQ